MAALEALVATFGDSASTGQVWIENHPTEAWLPGKVESLESNGCYRVVDENGEQFDVPKEKAHPVDENCISGVDDLLALGDFNEGALLHNIRVRYFRDDIYTGIGTPILISVNPYQDIEGLYSKEKRQWYRNKSSAQSAGADIKVPPHLFSVADAAWTAMQRDGRDQSIIISGESGSGKTEATKRILSFYANLQSDQSKRRSVQGSLIEEQVLRSNPILEAFGNAKTIRNDNSSRFGKFIQIGFNSVGKLMNSQISNYLLEKSRIVKQQPNERGYHAFYLLCAGVSSVDISAELGIRSAAEHTYTKVCTTIPGVDDERAFTDMVSCMDALGFSPEERDGIFKILAAVLHLGDLQFEEYPNSAD